MMMRIDVPDDVLVAFCGGQWGCASITNVGMIVEQYLYTDPQRIHERKMLLGKLLVDVLEHQLKKNKE